MRPGVSTILVWVWGIDMVACYRVATGILVVLAVSAASVAVESPLEFDSSQGKLNECFAWAKGQALAYAHPSDPVGPWYEAALPGREAFCMRDVSHQAMGAHALGLGETTRNMLRKFAVNISESKDWCSFWEINRYDKPAPVDYRSDEDFWYNLPANFDVLDACWRMYLWTHDRTYLNDPAFVTFYRRTVRDYVDRWDLGLDTLLERERFMNGPAGAEPVGRRGIPSYHEGDPGRTRIGVDLPAFQVAAYRSYAQILKLKGDEAGARRFEKKAEAAGRFIEAHFWDAANDRFHELLRTDGQYVTGGAMQVYLLYNDALPSEDKAQKTVRNIIDGARINIEMGSHYPEVFYRYGAHEEAYRWLLALSDPNTKRREYPEVSFAVVGAMVNGLMGIEPSANEGGVATLSRLTDQVAWAQLRHLPIHGCRIDVRHDGRTETTLSNRSNEPVIWSARFYGSAGELRADGRSVPVHCGADPAGRPYLWTTVRVAPSRSVTIHATVSQ